MPPSVPPLHRMDSEESNISQSRRVVAQAVAALIFGLLSPLVWFEPVFLPAPLLGVAFGVWALRRIKKSDPSVVGRKGAILGIALSVLSGVGVITNWFVYRQMVCTEAQQAGETWLRDLLEGQPQKAHQLTLFLEQRSPSNDRLWDVYRNDPTLRQNLEGFVGAPLVRTLLALGPRAYARFYEVAGQDNEDIGDSITLYYAITYDDAGDRKSFFVRLILLRVKEGDGHIAWRVANSEGGVKPEDWK
jgi:hypothetical protein